MPLSASIVRFCLTAIPLPGRIARPFLQRLNPNCPSRPVTIRSGNGFLVEIWDFSEYIQRNIYFLGRYEVRETRAVQRLLNPGDTFVDVGANIGWFTLLAAKCVGSSGHVLSFEPCTAIRKHLEKNVEINQLTNVSIDSRALSDTVGSAILSAASKENAGIGSIVSGNSAGESVITIPFDDVFPTLGVESIKLAKVDVEGAEFKVLKGMDGVLREKRCHHLLIEVNDAKLQTLGSSVSELTSWLGERGYVTRSIPLKKGLHISEENLLASCVP